MRSGCYWRRSLGPIPPGVIGIDIFASQEDEAALPVPFHTSIASGLDCQGHSLKERPLFLIHPAAKKRRVVFCGLLKLFIISVAVCAEKPLASQSFFFLSHKKQHPHL